MIVHETHTAFPSLTASGVTVHSATYYDDYDFNRTGTPDATYLPDTENFPDHSPSNLLRGQVTAVKVQVLEKDTDMPDWLWTMTFYDKYGREIQTQAENHLKGQDITWQEYNFAGELLLSKHAHTGYFFDQPPGPDFDPYERSATIFKSYTYDHRGRLLRIEQKTEDPDNPGHETDFTTRRTDRSRPVRTTFLAR